LLNNLKELLEITQSLPNKVIAVTAADDYNILKVVKEVENIGLAKCLLVGNKEQILRINENLKIIDVNKKIIESNSYIDSAKKAVFLVKNGTADLIMKGNLPTAVFIKAILDKENGIRVKGLLSQVSVFDKVEDKGLQLLTDCALNIQPTLSEKIGIVENSVLLAKIIGYQKPKVAVLSALETVNPNMPDTFDAAILSKMAERGQIKDVIIDGPLALDNAISLKAALNKGIKSEVAGKADILIVSDIRVGNVLHKSIGFYAKKEIAAIVIGGRLPIIMCSRSDSLRSKILSVALAAYMISKKA